jgi:pimeloyl-ACP methyl ester carboxylesterase
LRAAGRDVWLLTLRSGMGLPRKQWPHIRFSRMVRHDLPEAIAEVLRRTGQSQLDYIGFSMGGMLAYAALGRTVPLHQVRRVVIQGSPGKVVPPLQVLRLLRWCPKTVWPALPIRLAAQMTAPWSEFLQTPAQRLVCNASNMTPGAIRRVAAQGTHTVSPALQYQLYQWAFPCGGTLMLGGQPVLAGLAEVAVPVLFFAGRGDRLASPGAVAAAFEAWGSNLTAPIRHLVVLDKVHAAADYGHLDLAAGREAAREVFAPIAAFLSAADPADPAGFLPTKLLPACRSGLTPYSRPAKAEAA